MFIDFLTLLMINLAAGMALLALFVFRGMAAENQRSFAAGFGMVGLIALIGGFQMVFTWPLPGSYNIAFGESTVLFGMVFLGAAVSLALGWDLLPVAVYASFTGLQAVLVGIRIISLGLTREPLASGAGFLLVGIGGMAAAPAVAFLKKSKITRYLGTAVLAAAAFFWVLAFFQAMWGHLDSFSSWLPSTMR